MTHFSELSLNELLLAYADGEVKAFEEFFRRTEVIIYRFIRKNLVQPEMAQEAFQETYLRAHRYILSFRESDGHAIAWLLGIARRCSIDVLKRERAHRAIALDENIPQRGSDLGEIKLFYKQLLEELTKEISPADRQLLIDRFVFEFSFDEIALKHQTQSASARQRVSRLLRKLKVKFNTDS